MQIILVCILCELLPLMDLDILYGFLYTLEMSLYLCKPLLVWYYNFTTTFQLMLTINAGT